MQKQDEIEIKEILNFLLLKKKIIGIVTLSGLLLGISIALTTPKKYEVKISFINEQKAGTGLGGQGLAGLAGLTGVSFQNMQNAISPRIYPDILGSAAFVTKVGEMEFLSIDRIKMTLNTFLEEHQKSSLLNNLIKLPSGFFALFNDGEDAEIPRGNDTLINNEWIFLDEEYLALSSHLENSLEINSSRSDIIEIIVIHQDPYIAGALAELAYDFLTEYIAKYELSKENKKLDFTEKQLEKVRERFLEAQNKLARFRDRNTNIVSAQARSEEERLQADYNVAFNVFNAIMVQKEEVQLKLEDNIPAFTVVEKIKIPEKPSWPNRKLIVIITVFASLFLSMVYFLVIFFIRRL